MDLSLSFSVVFPLWIYICLGLVSKKIGLLDDYTINKTNSFVFKVLFPIMMFKNIQSAASAVASGELDIILVGLAFAAGSIILLVLFVPIFIKDKVRQSTVIMGSFRGNGLLFSLPIIAEIYGETNTGIAAAGLAVLVPFYNIVSVVLLKVSTGQKIKFKSLLIGIIKNPIIMGALVGMLVLLAEIHIPDILQKPISTLSSMVSPLALILLGGGLKLDNIRADLRHIAIVMFVKLIIYPAAALAVSYMLGYRGIPLISLFVINCVPTAVGTYTMAKEMSTDGDFAGELVAMGTIVSLASIFLWVLVLASFGLL